MSSRMLIFLGSTLTGLNVYADNSLSAAQLQKAISSSVTDYSTVNPDMANLISGLRVSTIGANAQVVIDMNADGMKMSAKYLCGAQASDMVCRQQ